MNRQFTAYVTQDCDDWTDFELYRHARHDIRLTFYKATRHWEAELKIADNEQADFGDPRPLPDSMVEKLSHIVRDCLEVEKCRN